MLMIGSAGRDVGKTEFACNLVRRLAAESPVVAAKVTTVHDNHGRCPRGGEGCGVCTSLTAPFEIVEERGGAPGKDTVRLLEAGARKVYWLRTRFEHLDAAAAHLLETIGPGRVCVCESNSLSRAVAPGLFVMLQKAGSDAAKRSAAEVRHLADIEIESDGIRFSVAPEELVVAPGPRWAYKRPATAVVLAGGASERMGRDKALLPFRGGTLIEHIVAQLEPHFGEILISTNSPARYAFLGKKAVVDQLPDQGPMMGVASALAVSSHDWNFFVPCDTPFVPIEVVLDLLRRARGGDGALPVQRDGRWEPLFAVYHRRLRPQMEAALAHGERRIARLFPKFDLRFVALAEGQTLLDVDTPEDFALLPELG